MIIWTPYEKRSFPAGGGPIVVRIKTQKVQFRVTALFSLNVFFRETTRTHHFFSLHYFHTFSSLEVVLYYFYGY